MIAVLAGLLFCQLLGEVTVRTLNLPLPGPVAGFGLMFAFLVWRSRRYEEPIPAELGRVADTFMRNLSLLFIPAAVGVVQYLGLLGRFLGSIAVTIVISTTMALIVTVVTFRIASLLSAAGKNSPNEDISRSFDDERLR